MSSLYHEDRNTQRCRTDLELFGNYGVTLTKEDFALLRQSTEVGIILEILVGQG